MAALNFFFFFGFDTQIFVFNAEIVFEFVNVPYRWFKRNWFVYVIIC